MTAGAVSSIPAALIVYALVRRSDFVLYILLGFTGSVVAGLIYALFVRPDHGGVSGCILRTAAPSYPPQPDAWRKWTMIGETDRHILKLLAKEWDFKGPPGILDVSDIVAALPLAPSDVLEGLKALFEHGLVDMNSLKSSAFLTPEGYEAISGPDPG